jgi:hypothetical protein
MSNEMMIFEPRIGKDVEERAVSYFSAISKHIHGGDKETRKTMTL